MTPPVRTGLLAAALSVVASLAHAACADYAPQPKPQNVGRDIVGHDLDTIIDRGWMEFAVYEDFPPYSYRDAGRLQGVDIAIGRLIADELGVDARFMTAAAGENLDADLRNYVWKGPIIGGRVANVMLRVPFDVEFACRVEQAVMTGQYATETIAVAYDEASYPDAAPTPAYFRFDKVGVENDSISDFFLTSAFGGRIGPNVTRSTTVVEAMALLADGAVKAVMAPRAQLEHSLVAGQAVHEPPLLGFASSRWTIGLAVNFRYRPLAYSVDDAIAAGLADGRVAKIFEDRGLTFVPPER